MIIFRDGVAVELTPEEEAAFEAGRGISPDQIKQDILNATQMALDSFAQTRNYSGIMSACTYVSSTNPTFAAEGAYCVDLRDQTWAKLYEMLAEVQAGTRPIPSSYADIAPELPVTSAAWPT
jgi:hypothetical protein